MQFNLYFTILFMTTNIIYCNVYIIKIVQLVEPSEMTDITPIIIGCVWKKSINRYFSLQLNVQQCWSRFRLWWRVFVIILCLVCVSRPLTMRFTALIASLPWCSNKLFYIVFFLLWSFMLWNLYSKFLCTYIWRNGTQIIWKTQKMLEKLKDGSNKSKRLIRVYLFKKKTHTHIQCNFIFTISFYFG